MTARQRPGVGVATHRNPERVVHIATKALRVRNGRNTRLPKRCSFVGEESGATAVLAALTAPLLLALAGLGAEGGNAYFKHAAMQPVADAAALSGAAAFKVTGSRSTFPKIEATGVAAQMG